MKESLEPKKLALLRILQILEQYTCPDHPLTQDDIAARLAGDYGIELERKAIGRNLSLLKEAGYDIESDRRGSYLASREFDDSELRMLIDGVLASKYITARHSKELIEKLCALSDRHFRAHVKNIWSVNEWSKTDNCAVFYNIEVADGAGEMETDCRDYNAAVYFYASQDDNKASYVGTVENTHAADNFGTYSMTFHLTDIANKAAPQYYHGTADVTSGSKVDSTIYPKGESTSVNKITDYDKPFFLIAKVDCREAVQSENITYAYATHIDGYTFVKIEGDNGGDGVTTDKVTSEVYLVFRGGEYVGHEINTTVKSGEVNTTYFLQFALTR